MSIDEVFPNPTVQRVIFQINFPNLFYIENKIGDLQMRIMKEFPESSLLFRRQIVFADMGPDTILDSVVEPDKEMSKKIWQFRSKKKYLLNVLSNSLDITSEYHKTYNLGAGDKFRDIIQFVCDNFLDVTSVSVLNRIGLRYIDECPLPSKDNAAFAEYYNSVFPIERFNLAFADEMDFKTVVKRGDYHLRYIESLKKKDDEYKLILDFDGFAKDVDPKDYLNVTDILHTIISGEYEATIKGPVYEYMRQNKQELK